MRPSAIWRRTVAGAIPGDPAVVVVGDVQVAGVVEREAHRVLERGGERRPASPEWPRCPLPATIVGRLAVICYLLGLGRWSGPSRQDSHWCPDA